MSHGRLQKGKKVFYQQIYVVAGGNFIFYKFNQNPVQNTDVTFHDFLYFEFKKSNQIYVE